MTMKTVETLVKEIEKTDKEVVGLKERITIVGQEKLNKIIQIALKGLEFEGIYKNAFCHDEESDHDGEYYLNERGEVLKGIEVLAMIEDSNETDEEEWELHKEVFLLNDGTFKTFDTIYRSLHCSDCEVMHTFIERVEAEEDYESEYRNEIIINNILLSLSLRAAEMKSEKEGMVERLKKLNSLQVS